MLLCRSVESSVGIVFGSFGAWFTRAQWVIGRMDGWKVWSRVFCRLLVHSGLDAAMSGLLLTTPSLYAFFDHVHRSSGLRGTAESVCVAFPVASST